MASQPSMRSFAAFRMTGMEELLRVPEDMRVSASQLGAVLRTDSRKSAVKRPI